MLPKKNRVDTREIERIFKDSIFLSSTNLTFKYFKNNNNKEIKISFIAPKNIAKLAVQRNFLRRRGYSVLEKHIKIFPLGITGVFIFKKYQNDVLILENEIKTILAKIN